MKKLFLPLVLLTLLLASLPASSQELTLEVPAGAAAELTAAKSESAVYIVRMIDAPVVAYEGDIAGLAATKPGNGQKINPNSAHVRKYVDYLQSGHEAALNAVGAAGKKLYSYQYVFNGFAAELTEAQVAGLMALPSVLTVEADQMGQLDTVSTPDFLGLTAEGGLWDMGFVGEDVIVGIVDSGIWPENPSFSDRVGTGPNGQAGKLAYQQIPGWHGKCTPGEAFPASDCNQKLIGAQWFNQGFGGNAGVKAQFPYEFASARDADGHGSHTASTAAGNAGIPAAAEGINLGQISGIAPRARIAVYKTCWGNNGEGGCFNSDNVAAIDQAVADGVDVINYSISGTRTNFLDAVEVAFLFAADAGVFVSASAGNSGPTASTVAHPSPWIMTTAASTHDRVYEGTVTLGNGAVYYGSSLTAGTGPAELVYSANVGLAGANATEVRLCYPGTLDPAAVSGKIVVCDRGVIARVAKSQAVAEANGAGMILANTGPSSVNADLHYVPTVHVDHIDGAAIRAYAQAGGGTATLTGGNLLTGEAPFMAAFSSRGPLLAGNGDLLKPDITAPGVDILAAVSPIGYNGRNYDFLSGTSMSSPHIAGIGALMKEAYPSWSPSMIKSALMTTASQVTNQGNPIDGGPFAYGAGHVTPNAAINPGLVYDAGFVDWLGFLCGTGQLQASYCPAIGIDPSDLNYPSIAIGALAGSQTVRRTVTNVAGGTHTYNVSVTPPAGIDVIVNPSSLTLAPGESATYEVTFVATGSAVLDQYAAGSLTWSHGPHAVRSPLVVKPVKLGVPSVVTGAGESGSLSFDVGFGYTGDYTAAPHGLEPALQTAGSVVDDPANDINVALGTGVGITIHPIPVPAGSAYARFSLFDDYTDGQDDLDLYIFGPTGFVGGSGSGTSAEEVNLAFPAAGTYFAVVHGWQTDGPDASYTLFSWAFSATPGGSLTIDSAPAAAVIGASGSVDISWSGLAPGNKYLGAVSHSDASGLIDLTLVEVATD